MQSAAEGITAKSLSGSAHYTAAAKNLIGPDAATGVALTVTLPASAYYVSATPTQGSCSESAGVVSC